MQSYQIHLKEKIDELVKLVEEIGKKAQSGDQISNSNISKADKIRKRDYGK